MDLVPAEVFFGHKDGRTTLLYKLSLSFKITGKGDSNAVILIEFGGNSLSLQPVWCRTNQLPEGLRRLISELTPQNPTSEALATWFLCEYTEGRLTALRLFDDGFNPKCYPTDDDAYTDWVNGVR